MTKAVQPFSGTFAAERSSGAASYALAADGSIPTIT
jgi:hypothetical protein